MSKKDKIVQLRKNGYTINEIVNELHCAKGTVSYHINNANIGGNIKNFLYDIKNEDIELVKKLRLDEKTYDEIHDITEISIDKIKKICRKFKLNKQVFVNRKKFNKDEVLNYYNKVKSLKLTARYFNTSRDTIRKHIDDNDIIKKKEKKKTNSQAVMDWRKRKKKELVQYKGGKCEICGYNKSINVLQFHHINPEEKDFTIGSKSYSLEKLKREVDKCILLCANCHIEIHSKDS